MKSSTVAARLVVAAASLALLVGCTAAATPSASPAQVEPSVSPSPSPIAATSPSPAPSAEVSIEPSRAPGTPEPPPSMPPSTTGGAWRATGKTIEGHVLGTATLLPDGRVLLAGGRASIEDMKPSASAELYDSTTGTWAATGAMAQARWGHTATLLADGRVLVIGGIASGCIGATTPLCGDQLASAELFDPGTGSWAAAESLHVARSGHTATLLPDGQVLVAGGYDVKGAETASVEILGQTAAELFDPHSGRWTIAGTMVDARAGHTSTLLPDGRLLVAGGDVVASNAGRSAELYDPGTGRWTATGSMTDARRDHTATLLPDGRVLVAGGFAGSDYTVDPPCSGPPAPCSAEIFDPGSGRWTATGSMDTDRRGHTATLLRDGTVLVVGHGTGFTPASAELYDPTGGEWTITAGPLVTRGLTATMLLDGRVLVTGDLSDDSRVAEVYDPSLAN